MANQTQLIGRANSLADAIALLRAQSSLECSVIRVSSQTRSGAIIVEQQHEIIDARVDSGEEDPQKALIALLAVTEGQYEVFQLDDENSKHVRHALCIDLTTVCQDVEAAFGQSLPSEGQTKESPAPLDHEAQGERTKLAWRIKDSLVETYTNLPRPKSPVQNLIVLLLVLILPVYVVGYLVMRGMASGAVALQQNKQDGSAVEVGAGQSVVPAAEKKPDAQKASAASVGEPALDQKQLDSIDRQMAAAQKLEADGKVDQAIDAYAAIIDRHPKYALPRIAIIKAYMVKADYTHAADYCREGQMNAVNQSDQRYFTQLLARIPIGL